ncbi:MAG: 3'(2'),5'-bisphosphate nucleotidase [Deltaproteobacteria bacterium]|nr:MAG: 3'(2'),5'-bisphosphate nucleotidase [Deltaproteobacteria bacterium]
MTRLKQEREVALRAVEKAASLCEAVWAEEGEALALTKKDRSPASVADFGSQAVVCRTLSLAFPEDPIVAEESARDVTKSEHVDILKRLHTHVQRIYEGEEHEVLDWLRLGAHRLASRYWVLDPIDGTQGYLEGGQYAVALALVEDGVVQLGVIACPRLGDALSHDAAGQGVWFLGVRGEGAWTAPLGSYDWQSIQVATRHDAGGAWVEGCSPKRTHHAHHKTLAQHMGLAASSLRVDSMAKYAMVARGQSVLYLRLPKPEHATYREKIWDHAAGVVLVEEAGGRVTDQHGGPLDFASSYLLEPGGGVVVSNGSLHEQLLDAIAAGAESSESA